MIKNPEGKYTYRTMVYSGPHSLDNVLNSGIIDLDNRMTSWYAEIAYAQDRATLESDLSGDVSPME